MSTSTPNVSQIQRRGRKNSQEIRRRDYLLHQKESRRTLVEQSRCIVILNAKIFQSEDFCVDENQSIEKSSRKSAIEKNNPIQHNLLCLPEWMIEIPNFNEEFEQDVKSDVINDNIFFSKLISWIVYPRPEGFRCSISSSNKSKMVFCRSVDGHIQKSFNSLLPKNCLLDCIYNEKNQTYYAIDILMWKGQSLLDTTFEFRLFWLNNRLQEEETNQTNNYNHYIIAPLPYFDCDLSGLQNAYEGNYPFQRDGLLFYHKYGHYQTGQSSLALVWKDHRTSQFIPSDIPQYVNLRVGDVSVSTAPFAEADLSHHHQQQQQQQSVALFTVDDMEIGPVPLVAQQALQLAEGDVVTCSLHAALEGSEGAAGEAMGGQEVHVERRAAGRADSWSKVLFINRLLFGSIEPIGIDELLSAVST